MREILPAIRAAARLGRVALAATFAVGPLAAAAGAGVEAAGPHIIRGGAVSLAFGQDGKPLSFARGQGPNLIRKSDPGPGFVLTYGEGAAATVVPLSSVETRDGRMIFSGADGARVTFAVTAGLAHVAFRLERLEHIREQDRPVLSFRAEFDNVSPQVVPFDYMTVSAGEWASKRCFVSVSWPYLWRRGERDPLGGFAFFVPRDDEEHNESLLRVWTEERVPHPKVEGPWTYERARAWVQEWETRFQNTHTMIISPGKPGDLDLLLEYARKLQVNRLYLHTDIWRGGYWVQGRDPLSVQKEIFPRGEADLKAFQDKLRAHHMDAMLHTICYGFGLEGSKYIGKGKKTDRRLANWGKGTLAKAIAATDRAILVRPDPGVRFPDAASHGGWWTFNDVLIGDEIIQVRFRDTDQPVWTLTDCVRGSEPQGHEAGTEVMGLLKAYGQNYYPDSRTDLSEITAREYAEFFNRLGLQHHEYDGGECHNDVPWGYAKWTMHVYQNTERPMTSNSSGGGPNPWDLVYRFKRDSAPNLHRRGGGSAGLMLHRDGRLATSPMENHFTLAPGAAGNSRGFWFQKPEAMFGISPNVLRDHGLAAALADQFAVWREVAPRLTPELRRQITDAYFLDNAPYSMNRPSSHRSAKIIHEARRASGGYEIQPFTIMTRGKADADGTTVQEFGIILPRQHVGPGQRLRLENPFGRQAPHFIIRVMNGYADGWAAIPSNHPAPVLSSEMQGYLRGAGVREENLTPAVATVPAAPAGGSANFLMQPKAAAIAPIGGYQVRDVGPALELALDNVNKEEIFQEDGFPSFAFPGDARNARGVALTVTGDGSGAYLVIQVGPNKDYVIPIDFAGRKDIFIPVGEAARTLGRWGMRYPTRHAGYGPFRRVAIGFGRVPAQASPKVLVENLRMVGEVPSMMRNPVIHAAAGTLTIQGEVRSDQYLWYQGGETVGLYDLNWNQRATLPVKLDRYSVEQGCSEFWIDGEAVQPVPWFDVQFITKGETISLKDPPHRTSNQLETK